MVLENVAAMSMDQEERRSRPGGAKRNQRTPGGLPPLVAEHLCKLGNRRRMQKRGKRHLNSGGFFAFHCNSDRQQRVPTQIKEVVAHPNALNPKHLGPDLGQKELEGISRTCVFLAVRILITWKRERLTINLSIRG